MLDVVSVTTGLRRQIRRYCFEGRFEGAFEWGYSGGLNTLVVHRLCLSIRPLNALAQRRSLLISFTDSSPILSAFIQNSTYVDYTVEAKRPSTGQFCF